MSKFEQDVFWKDGSEIEDQVIIPFRTFELNKFLREHVEGGKVPLEVIGFKFEGKITNLYKKCHFIYRFSLTTGI